MSHCTVSLHKIIMTVVGRRLTLLAEYIMIVFFFLFHRRMAPREAVLLLLVLATFLVSGALLLNHYKKGNCGLNIVIVIQCFWRGEVEVLNDKKRTSDSVSQHRDVLIILLCTCCDL